MESCDNETQKMHDDLSSVPMQDLSFADLMFLTGHNSCCGNKRRQEKKRQQFIDKVKAGSVRPIND